MNVQEAVKKYFCSQCWPSSVVYSMLQDLTSMISQQASDIYVIETVNRTIFLSPVYSKNGFSKKGSLDN